MKNNPTSLATKTIPKHTVLLIPEDAWATLYESIVLDTQSAGVDRPLREELKKALAEVRTITTEVTALLTVAEEVPRCAFIRSGDGELKYHVVGDERMGKLDAALRFFRSPFKMLGGHRCYRKQLL